MLVFDETNLSHAWGKAFLHILKFGEISPLVISVSGFNEKGEPDEDPNIRAALDKCLANKKKVQTVANTIFPHSVWKRYQNDRKAFFEHYLNQTFPKVKRLDRRNERGNYFQRLIDFGSGPNNGNQLEFIISQYKSRKTVRRSMLQASIFDPERDHLTRAQLGFPCLQHLSFVPNNDNYTLSLNAFYATQQIFQKAYGNYLGLCRLGNFMGHEMGLTFNRMNCFIGVEKLEGKGVNQKSLAPLITVVQDILQV